MVIAVYTLASCFEVTPGSFYNANWEEMDPDSTRINQINVDTLGSGPRAVNVELNAEIIEWENFILTDILSKVPSVPVQCLHSFIKVGLVNALPSPPQGAVNLLPFPLISCLLLLRLLRRPCPRVSPGRQD